MGRDYFYAYVDDVSYDPLRPYWVIWEEGGKYPNTIIELLSPSTARDDLGLKKRVYQNTFRTPDYFCYDPDTEKLLGWRLKERSYQPLKANEHGWLWCEELKLWLGKWRGKHQDCEATWLRFFNGNGRVVPTFAEAAEAEIARLKAQLKKKSK